MQTRNPDASPAGGFTLIELLTAVVLLGALLMTAPAAYADWIAAQQLANHTRYFADTLQLARSEAIKHGFRVNVCKSSDGRQCDARAGWESGWIMFVDQNRDGEVEDEEQIIRREGHAPDGVTVTANHPVADYVSYTALGHARLLSGAALGEPGNLELAGHRTSWFEPLQKVALGDVIEIEWYDSRRAALRTRTYVVGEIRVVAPEDVALLAPTSVDALTLITCYPFGRSPRSPQRYIVRALPAGPAIAYCCQPPPSAR